MRGKDYFINRIAAPPRIAIPVTITPAHAIFEQIEKTASLPKRSAPAMRARRNAIVNSIARKWARSLVPQGNNAGT